MLHSTPVFRFYLTPLLVLLALSTISQAFAARYSLDDLDSLPTGYTLSGINNAGTIVGLDDTQNPFFWRIYTDPETEKKRYIRQPNLVDFFSLLPTHTLGIQENAALGIAENLGFTEIQVSAINNERSTGNGGNIVGWYTNNNGNDQSVLWFQQINALEKYEYKALTLPALTENARNCKANASENYLTPECIYAGSDDVRINQMKQCATENENWKSTGGAVIPPCDTDTDALIPVCEYSIKKNVAANQNSLGENAVSGTRYEYEYNSDKISGQCVLREHIEIALLASQCAENDNWVDNSVEGSLDPIMPIVITCDKQSRAFSINNNNTIVGVSFDQSKDSPHPVAWIRTEGTNTAGAPNYKAINLGVERVDITPQSVLDYNGSRTEDEPEKSISIQVKRRLGKALISSTSTADVAGILKTEPTDPEFKAYYWPSVSENSFVLPMELRSPVKDSNGVYTSFATPPSITAIASRFVGGWYLGNDGLDRAIQWLLVPSRGENDQAIDVLVPSHLALLKDNEEGRILHTNSSSETIGTSKIIDENNTTDKHAFYKSPQCGTQDLNQLLATPNATPRLTRAYQIASGSPPNSIIAQGNDPAAPNDALKNYVLLPEEVYVDLKIELEAKTNTLTVGDEQPYYITLTNNASNYATCVVFIFKAAVYTPEADENAPPQKELLAGLSFLRVESESDIACSITPVQVLCGLARLDPGSPIKVTITTRPRPLLADRTIKTSVNLYSSEQETTETQADNSTFVINNVNRQGCFIATAAYGSYLSPEVAGLRDFRDEVLLKTAPGRWLVETYYDVSPEYADDIAQDEQLRTVSRWILSPLVYLALYPLPMLSGLILLFYVGFRFRRRLKPVARK